MLQRSLAFPSASARHQYLLEHDPIYRRAYHRRRGGTALAIIGGGGGLVLAAVGLVATAVDSIDMSLGTNPHQQDDSVSPLVWGGLVTAAVSLAVGLPLALTGHGKVRAIRSRYPIVGVGWSRHSKGGALRLSWRF